MTPQADIALRLLCALKPFASHGRLDSITEIPTSNWLPFRCMRPCLLHYIVNWFSEMLQSTRIILWMCPANERRRYIVTSSFIGWAIHKMIPKRLPKLRFLWHNQFSTRRRHGSKAYALYGQAYVGEVNVHFVFCKSTIPETVCISMFTFAKCPHADVTFFLIRRHKRQQNSLYSANAMHHVFRMDNPKPKNQ